MIDIKFENLMRMRDVPNWCETNLGNRVSPSTTHRWRIRGARGVRLETILVGGTRYTSVESLNRFFAAATAAADSHLSSANSTSTNTTAESAANQGLERDGI